MKNGILTKRPSAPKVEKPKAEKPKAVQAIPERERKSIPIDAIGLNGKNRKIKWDKQTQETAANIGAIGMINPITVLQKAKGYEIVAGSRRLFIAKKLGCQTIDAFILPKDTDADYVREVTLSENIHRLDLKPIEEARVVALLLAKGKDTSAIARALGKTAGWVKRRAAVAAMSKSWMAWLEKNPDAPMEELEGVARVPAAVQERIFKQGCGCGSDEVNWHYVRKMLGESAFNLASAPFKPDDAGICPKAGPCSACPKRTGASPDLFDDVESLKKTDLCLDPVCYNTKVHAIIAARMTELQSKHDKVLRVGTFHYYSSDDLVRLGIDYSINNLTPSKKDAKNAVPGVFVDGQKAGHVGWYAPPGAKKKIARAKPDGGKSIGEVSDPKEKSKLQKERTEDRRNNALVDRIGELMRDQSKSKMAHDLKLESVGTLVAEFLSDDGHLADRYSVDPQKGARTILALGTGYAKSTTDAAFQKIVAALAKRINRFNKPVDTPVMDEALAWADLLAIDLSSVRAEIAKEITYPKSIAADTIDKWAAVVTVCGVNLER